MKLHNTEVIEIAQNIKTKSGTADLFKCWSESTKTIATVWNDKANPNPYLIALKVGSKLRLIEEEREEFDMNGKRVTKSYFTPLPAAPEA
jgi:hypothetical protein